MIFTRWGERLEIVANCGEHVPAGGSVPVTLVKVRYPDRSAADVTGLGSYGGFEFIAYLKADDGLIEIQEAVDAAEDLDLAGDGLDVAILRAS